MIDTAKMLSMQQSLSTKLDALNRELDAYRKAYETQKARIEDEKAALIRAYIDGLAEEEKHDQVR